MCKRDRNSGGIPSSGCNSPLKKCVPGCTSKVCPRLCQYGNPSARHWRSQWHTKFPTKPFFNGRNSSRESMATLHVLFFVSLLVFSLCPLCFSVVNPLLHTRLQPCKHRPFLRPLLPIGRFLRMIIVEAVGKLAEIFWKVSFSSRLLSLSRSPTENPDPPQRNPTRHTRWKIPNGMGSAF